MLTLKTAELPETAQGEAAQAEEEQLIPPPPTGRKPFFFRWARWRKASPRPILGIDIGSHSIKAVVLVRRRGQIELGEAALAETPPLALTQGTLTDGLLLSERLRSMRAMFHLQTNRAAVAAGGEKVYCQADSVRAEEGESFNALVENTAQAVVPYALSSAAFDYQELDGGSETSPRTVLWVSSTPDQVDWLRQTLALAGMVPAVVDVEACALANAFVYNHEPDPEQVSVLVNVGVRQATIALLRGESLVYARGVVLTGRSPAHESSPLADRVMEEIDRYWDELNEAAHPGFMQHIYLSGGPARDPALAQTIGRRCGLSAYVMDPFRRIQYDSSSEAGRIAALQTPTLAVAVGLALRSFPDL